MYPQHLRGSKLEAVLHKAALPLPLGQQNLPALLGRGLYGFGGGGRI